MMVWDHFKTSMLVYKHQSTNNTGLTNDISVLLDDKHSIQLVKNSTTATRTGFHQETV